MVPERLWYCTVYRLCCQGLSILMYTVPAQQAVKQSFSYKFIDEELQAGRNSICLCLTGVLLWPPRRPPWTASVHFPDSYPVDVSHLNFNIDQWQKHIFFSPFLSYRKRQESKKSAWVLFFPFAAILWSEVQALYMPVTVSSFLSLKIILLKLLKNLTFFQKSEECIALSITWGWRGKIQN